MALEALGDKSPMTLVTHSAIIPVTRPSPARMPSLIGSGSPNSSDVAGRPTVPAIGKLTPACDAAIMTKVKTTVSPMARVCSRVATVSVP